MKLKLLLLIAVILSISMPSSAQLPLPTRTIGGTQFYYHEVQKKETLYSIAKKLGIDKSDIIKYNPNAAEKIKEGQFLFFPVSDFANLSNKATTQNAQADASTTAPTSFDHIVEKGETLYGIAKNYGVSTEDIIKLNSNANSGIKEGQTLKIPQNAAMQQGQEIAAATETEVTPEDTTLIYVTIRPGDTLFSTAKRYNTSIDKLMELNPGISPQNFKSGEVIRVRPNYYTTITTERETTEFHTYEIKRGDTYFSIDEFDNAIKAYCDAIKINPENAKAYCKCGMALWEKDYTEEAIVAYHKAIALNPEYSIAYNNLGVIYLDDIGNVNESIELFTKAIESNEEYALAYFNLARAYAMLGQNTKAAGYFQKSLDLNEFTGELDEEDIRYRLHKLFEV